MTAESIQSRLLSEEQAVLSLRGMYAEFLTRFLALKNERGAYVALAEEIDVPVSDVYNLLHGKRVIFGSLAEPYFTAMRMKTKYPQWKRLCESLTNKHYRVLLSHSEELVRLHFDYLRFIYSVGSKAHHSPRDIIAAMGTPFPDKLYSFLRPTKDACSYFEDDQNIEQLRASLDKELVDRRLVRYDEEMAAYQKALRATYDSICEKEQLTDGQVAELVGYSSSSLKSAKSQRMNLNILAETVAQLGKMTTLDVDLSPPEMETIVQTVQPEVAEQRTPVFDEKDGVTTVTREDLASLVGELGPHGINGVISDRNWRALALTDKKAFVNLLVSLVKSTRIAINIATLVNEESPLKFRRKQLDEISELYRSLEVFFSDIPHELAQEIRESRQFLVSSRRGKK